TNSQCCSGNCVKVGTNPTGTCGIPGGNGAGTCNVSGTLCPSGAVQCDISCCSRACGPIGGENRKNLFPKPSGRPPAGELCQKPSDCCGTNCSKTNPTDQYGRCDKGNACSTAGQTCKVGGTDSCSVANNCCEPPGMPSGTCNNSPELCCKLDSEKIPRCL